MNVVVSTITDAIRSDPQAHLQEMVDEQLVVRDTGSDGITSYIPVPVHEHAWKFRNVVNHETYINCEIRCGVKFCPATSFRRIPVGDVQEPS